MSSTPRYEGPQRFRAQTLDLGLEVLASVCVPHIHLVLDLPGRLDAQRLADAVRLSVDADPILGCRLVRRFFRPYWQRLAPGALTPDRLFESAALPAADREARSQAFLARPLEAGEGPALQALHLSGGDGDRLLLKVHHHVADAGGTKEVGYRVAEMYRRLADEPRLQPTPRLGSRSLKQVYRRFVPRRIPALLGAILREMKRTQVPARNHIVPTGDREEGLPHFATLHLDRRQTARCAAWASQRGATLNDLAVAALVRTFAEESSWDGSQVIRMAATVDLRRYLPDERAGAVCNLSGFMFPTLRGGSGRDLGDTLARVKADIDAMKQDCFGLPFNLGGHLVFGLWPPGLRIPLLRWIFQANRRRNNQAPGLTNMGPIDRARLDFGDQSPGEAHLVVPASGHGFVLPGLSGYDGSLTWTLGHYPSAISTERVERMFSLLRDELTVG